MKKIKYSDEYLFHRINWYYVCYDYIEAADYKNATEFSRTGLSLFPDDTVAAYTHYSIMADYALSSTTPKFKKMHQEAIKQMKRLLGRTSGRGISKFFKRDMKNEYYYQTKQFKKQYELGQTYFKSWNDKLTLYSSGVGAANYALQLAKTNQKTKAKMWAKKAIEAWEIYFQADSNYYNPYVHYAMAWGILGNQKKMMDALKRASKQSGKPLSYREFKEVIEEIENINCQ